MKIAVCDDDKRTIDHLTLLIKEKESNASVVSFENGKTMLNTQDVFDMYFLDIEMGEISGLDVAKHIRAVEEKRNMEKSIIIFITGYREYMEYAFDVNAFHYLVKPIVGLIINVILIVSMQRMLFLKNTVGQSFSCLSFIAGKEIVKYIVSVLSMVLGSALVELINSLVIQGKVITDNQVLILTKGMIYVIDSACAILYAVLLATYLVLIDKKYIRKEYQLQMKESVFLILPSAAAICISIALRMMIITVENGSTELIYDAVPETLFWVPVICILLLGTVIANVTLFQNVVHYHEENRKTIFLENQIQHMHKEVKEIQDIYADMRGLRHDLRNHIDNIKQYITKYENCNKTELDGYVENMLDTVERLEFGYQTGNPITDLILHQKQQEAERKKISFSIDFCYPSNFEIDAYDIGIILNNALENAVEACESVQTERYIKLCSYMKGNLFFIEVENCFSRDIVINKEGGLPETSKQNSMFHGIGLTNIQRCARKYNGDIDIVIESRNREYKTFNLIVMLNGKSNKE